ncbi:hypothetical protein CC86DRAFT_309717 [Ophiobolus disseminans]|uniref:Lytic polysaccharide monooxygenase n=1 Tax=Ophiobolus disseminans TaxID=1469910 RepID=A0A6A6ZBT1_9PLEO|nr:hypothetical protein CC86DRAFT_309717 [Ophiobolus disseminans]
MNIRALHLLICASVGLTHMSLWYPPPLGGAREANALTTRVDDKLNFPLGCCDSDGAPTLASPGDCRGHLSLLNTEEGRPQVTWQSGQETYFQLSDHTYTPGAPGSTHFGGSCQVGFSTDKGQTWKVAASYHGNCPHRNQNDIQIFHFKVPTGMPEGPAVFAWIWLNREHESFMNCASVQIGRDSSNSTDPTLSNGTSSSRTRLDALPHPTQPSSTSSSRKRPTLLPQSTVWPEREKWADRPNNRDSSERNRHKHRRKHVKYHYSRAVDKHKVLRENGGLVKKLALQACDWKSAPRMETRYYTIDAKCAANAKLKNPRSDSFEISWSNACGITEGDKEYPVKDITC